jgi:two-component system response regulator CpxR
MERVLLIDDDVELCELVSELLAAEGFAVECVHDGAAGVQRGLSEQFALLILDVMLPKLNGLEVLRRLRQSTSTPVLMLTARGDDVDRIVGLELGADDYLPKPFNPRELTARIRAILRRTQARNEIKHERLAVGDIELDKGTRTVRRGGALLDLTGIEFDLLEVLLRAAGRVVTREQLVKDVLGREFNPFDRSLDMHLSNLRKKLGHELNTAAGPVERIRSVRGVGYLYAAVSE